MSNYIQNQLHIPGSKIGINYEQRFKTVDVGFNSVIRDIRTIDDDTIEFETRNIPPVEFLQKLSKLCPDAELIHTFNDEGRYMLEEQMKIKDGVFEGYRARYNDGEEVQPYPDWEPFPETAQDREACIQTCLSKFLPKGKEEER